VIAAWSVRHHHVIDEAIDEWRGRLRACVRTVEPTTLRTFAFLICCSHYLIGRPVHGSDSNHVTFRDKSALMMHVLKHTAETSCHFVFIAAITNEATYYTRKQYSQVFRTLCL